jgi:hypothetical protein
LSELPPRETRSLWLCGADTASPETKAINFGVRGRAPG